MNSKRKCKGCGRYLRQDNHPWVRINGSYFHTMDCAVKKASKNVVVAKKNRSKEKKQAWAKKKRDNKGLTYWIKESKIAAQECSAWRDNSKGCISCGMFLHQIKDDFLTRFDGGHYKSVGAHPELQLNLMNIHGQCRSCNGFKGGCPDEYRKGLILRYGENLVDKLEGPQPRVKWTLDYLEKYRRVIRKLTKRYKKRAEYDL